MLLSSFYLAICVFQSASSLLANMLPLQKSIDDYKCDPYIDCRTEGIGAKVPDPEDCHSYYLCVNSNGESVPSDIPLACPNGEYFDKFYGRCITESIPCYNECYKYCNLECATDYQLVAYPGNCSKYYLCFIGETKVEMDCPTGNPFFNGTECTDNSYLCCDSCIPYCTELSIEIEDPFDCHSFYICVETGPPSEEYHGKCPDGEYFDSGTNICVNGPVCTSICVDTISPTTSTIFTSPETTTVAGTGPAIVVV